ncbi:PP2C family serine/threonine-protein phosphatase [Noviherbaspirillum sp. UKPF54]|uniref:PP2C family serine/threonine-protein phosphatase n=1 Tax=Noviherbaspirillum sp. UKPF54 TaxID=2601898 RepID=UPI0011B1B246|nr:PP2C family serine/threonine-protein phosphatase [Noviherbaspirillum sp. UKPF54]QDZ26579.1 protein phosphatase 2C domain-containing protein [Noviherbaspirillum sp. UKPF54]
MKNREKLKLKKQPLETTATAVLATEGKVESTTAQTDAITDEPPRLDANEPPVSPPSSETLATFSKEEKFLYHPLTPSWLSQHEAIAGIKHRNMQPPLPCQDAAESGLAPMPFVIVADGAGSSPMSDLGAQSVVTALARLLKTLEVEVAGLLNQPQEAPDAGRRLSLMLVKHAMGVLMDLAQTHRRSVKDFRCTLLLAVIGKVNALWLKVGDGALVEEKMRIYPNNRLESEWRTLGAPGKGDFANETIFVDDRLQPDDVQSGLTSSADICALGAMSDGAALALVSNDGKQVAPRLSTWSNDLRTGKLKKSTLTASFYEADFSRRAMGDDCSIALVSCALKE